MDAMRRAAILFYQKFTIKLVIVNNSWKKSRLIEYQFKETMAVLNLIYN